MTHPRDRSPRLGRSRRRRLLSVLMLAILATSAAVFWQREQIWIRYCAFRLANAAPGDRTGWQERLADRGVPAVPTVLCLLQREDSSLCQAAVAVLRRIGQAPNRSDQERDEVWRLLAAAEPQFSNSGRLACLELLPVLWHDPSSGANQAARQLLESAVASSSIEVKIEVLRMALQGDARGGEILLPLLNDEEAEVRRAAILALGPAREGGGLAASDEQLLLALHDADEEVRRLAELGLRSRGRTPREIQLGKQLASPNSTDRQKLLNALADDDDLDVKVWLERLLVDADPSVRAGATRVAAQRANDLRSRIEEIRRFDPDPTVRRIAEYYLRKGCGKSLGSS